MNKSSNMEKLAKFQKFNKYFIRFTWIPLTIGLVDHFSCELEATKFACDFLPRGIAAFNLNMLWVLIGVIVISEFLSRRWEKKIRRTEDAGG